MLGCKQTRKTIYYFRLSRSPKTNSYLLSFADPSIFEHRDQLPGLFMSRYEDKPEYDETFFQVK